MCSYIGINMTLLFSVFCFVFASLYTSTTAQDVQVCVSYPNITSIDLAINVNWTFPDEVNITFEDRIGITSRVYNETSAVGIPFVLNSGRSTVNVTVCRLNTSSCRSVIAATTPIYNATWRRIDNTTLEFTCELACRTPAITGCNINLSGGSKPIANFSRVVSGTDEAISSRFVTVIVNNVDPTVEYSYTAIPQAIQDREIVSLNGIQGIIPAAIQVSITTEAVSSTLTPSVTTSLMLDTSSTDMFTTTSSITTSSMPISSSIAAMPSNTVTAGAADDNADDDDDDGYLPVIIAASCACVLLLVVAIILLIIIIRVKRRGSSSNLSSPSASKINNYDDLGDVKYFPMLDSQNNMQKSQSPPDDIQNQESHIRKAPEYEFPVFTSVEQNPQVAASYDLLSADDDKYDSPDAVLNTKPQSNDPPVDPLYDPVILESAARSDGPKSPVAEYDKLMHSPTPQPITHFPPSIYDTLSEKNLRDHYEFPDRKDENGMVESHTQLKRVATGNGDEYTVPQSS